MNTSATPHVSGSESEALLQERQLAGTPARSTDFPAGRPPVTRAPFRRFLTLGVALSLALPSTAHAQDLGSLTDLLQSGGLMSLIGMIPGLNFLAGLGPLTDILKVIPGLDTLLGQIPGLSQLLDLIGLGGGSNLGPLLGQIQQVQKWLTAARQIQDTAKNIIRPNNYTDFVASANSVMRLAGVNQVFSQGQYQQDPQGVARAAIDALTDQQREVLGRLRTVMTPAEAVAVREQAAGLQDLKARVQRNADNAEAQSNTQSLTKEAQDRALDALDYSQGAAQALKDNKKIEDISRMVGSASLESLRVSALNSAALTAALANQTKIQVAQAETLGQMLEEMQRSRLDKANAIARMMEAQRQQARREAQRLRNYSRNLTDGMGSAVSGASLRGVDLLGGP
ncbi:hypothetical protein DAERI_020351 [Deinococcus aerius]|uniref:Uncharacterized protein n=1 Tax=Deinococcus aerius TaxID=200253 RepID=A0A2I9CST5_9DEIO|nr:hypothetical protein DAERI_020351 [Deinococcus aerius]GMA17737.1 hypothetical protein GCM10025871_40680 [Deinococcus metallilatus]